MIDINQLNKCFIVPSCYSMWQDRKEINVLYVTGVRNFTVKFVKCSEHFLLFSYILINGLGSQILC